MHYPAYVCSLLSEKSFDFEQSTGNPDFELTTKLGEVIYILASYWLNVKLQNDRSLHVSFTIIRPRKINILKIFLDTLVKYDEHEDAPFPLYLTAENLVL